MAGLEDYPELRVKSRNVNQTPKRIPMLVEQPPQLIENGKDFLPSRPAILGVTFLFFLFKILKNFRWVAI